MNDSTLENTPTPEMSATTKSAMLLATCFNLVADAPYSIKRHEEVKTALEFLRQLHDQAMVAVEAENAALVAAESNAQESVNE